MLRWVSTVPKLLRNDEKPCWSIVIGHEKKKKKAHFALFLYPVLNVPSCFPLPSHVLLVKTARSQASEASPPTIQNSQGPSYTLKADN